MSGELSTANDNRKVALITGITGQVSPQNFCLCNVFFMINNAATRQ